MPGMRSSRILGRRDGGLIVEQRGETRFLVFTYPVDVQLLATARPPDLVEVHLLGGTLKRLDGAYRLQPDGQGRVALLWTGLIEPDTGGILFRGKEIDGPSPQRGVVFQSYSLMPWLTVAGNVGLAVNAVHKGKSRSERAAIVTRYIEMVGLGHAVGPQPLGDVARMRHRLDAFGVDRLHLADQPEDRIQLREHRTGLGFLEPKPGKLGDTAYVVESPPSHALCTRELADELRAVLERFAVDAGLNGSAYDECMASAKFAGRIEASSQEGQKLGVPSTPSFVIGNKLYPGAQSSDSIRVWVQALIPASPAPAPPARP